MPWYGYLAVIAYFGSWYGLLVFAMWAANTSGRK